jgi:hypothetical protein
MRVQKLAGRFLQSQDSLLRRANPYALGVLSRHPAELRRDL